MLKVWPLGEWRPDLAPSGTLTIARNMLPLANGYASVGAFSPLTSTLGDSCTGGGSFTDSTGASTTLLTTTSDIRKYGAGAWASIHSVVSSRRYRFAQFGDNVAYANGGTTGVYDLKAGTFSTPTNAPSFIDVARVRDFVMGITTANEARWSQFNDSSNYTTGVNQADTQPLLGGQGVAIVGGEYGIILRENGIDRVTYVGSANDIIFQFDEISAEYGCMSQGSVANSGRLIFFLSERGFALCDGESVTPIGDEKFNRWFFEAFSREDIQDKLQAAIDPRLNVVMWGMPGRPGTILAYNWELKRAATMSFGFDALLSGKTSNTSLDDLDATYGNLDAISLSLDDPSFAGGNPMVLLVDDNHIVGTFGNEALEATLKLSNIEPTPGRRSRIRTLRPITDATSATATVNARMRAGDTEGVVSASTMRSNGKMPVRANGRYNDITMTIPAGEAWSYIQGVEVEFEPGDNR